MKFLATPVTVIDTNFDVDRSRRFRLRALTNRQTDTYTQSQTQLLTSTYTLFTHRLAAWSQEGD